MSTSKKSSYHNIATNLLLYVDYILLATKRRLDLDNLKSKLSKKFEMKDMGNASKIIGIKTRRNIVEDKFLITQ